MALKYKVGDRVKIKSLDWYNKNKDEDGDVLCGDYEFVSHMTVFCGKILTIDVEFEDETYLMKEDIDGFVFTIEMIEGLAEEEMPLDKAGQITDFEYEGLAYSLPTGYQFVDENGNEILTNKIILKKKKKEVTYPKTYAECCKVLGVSEFEYNHTGTKMWYRHKLMAIIDDLMLCRDAYWKIAGEEMGLGKPWSPSDADYITGRYCIFVHKGNVICDTPAQDCILTFPTEEMRDAFKENFDPDIKNCKEFL